MKKKILSVSFIVICAVCYSVIINAQGVAINADGTEANGSAMLDVNATDAGILIPRMTEAQRVNIDNPASGLMVYQTDGSEGFYYNSGTPGTPVWQRLSFIDETGNVSGSGAATRVAFWDGETELSSDANLFWDNNNNRLDIGTTSPNYKLDISGEMHVRDKIRFDNPTVNQDFIHGEYQPAIFGSRSGGPHGWGSSFLVLQTGSSHSRGIVFGTSPGDDIIYERARIAGSGNFGIGTTNPEAKLHVNGSVRFSNLSSDSESTSLMIDGNGNISERTLNIADWDNAYSWGNHAEENYLTSFDESDPTWNGLANTTSAIGRIGNVGVGTENPDATLDVVGGFRVSDQAVFTFNPNVDFKTVDNATNYDEHSSIFLTGSQSYISFSDGRYGIGRFGANAFVDGFSWSTGITTSSRGFLGTTTPDPKIVLSWHDDGRVGIGTVSPSAKLHVDGDVRFSNLTPGSETTGLMIDGSGNISERTLNIENWNTAYNWGDHSAEDYLTDFDEIDPTWSGDATISSDIGRTGNVGIGTTSPDRKLHILGDVHVRDQIWFDNPSENQEYIQEQYEPAIFGSRSGGYFSGSSSLVLQAGGTHSNRHIYFGTGGAGGIETRMLIRNDGNIGIGTTSPSAKLHVDGDVRFSNLSPGSETTGLMIDGGGNISERTLNIDNWNTAYNWGDHSAEDYLTEFDEIDPTWSGAANTSSAIGRTGNVGIGTNNPIANIEISEVENAKLKFTSTKNHPIGGEGMVLGNIHFYSQYDSGPVLGTRAGIRAISEEEYSTSGNRGGTRLSFFTTPLVTTDLQESMRISGDGNVGIGTTNPAERLDVDGNITLSSGNTGTVYARNYQTHDGSSLYINDAGGSRGFRLNSTGVAIYNRLAVGTSNPDDAPSNGLYVNGNAGIGTTSPQSKQHINGNITTPFGFYMKHYNSGWGDNSERYFLRKAWTDDMSDYLYISATGNQNNNAQTAAIFSRSNGFLIGRGHNDGSQLSNEWMRVATNGNVGIGTTSPTQRLHVNGDVFINPSGSDNTEFVTDSHDFGWEDEIDPVIRPTNNERGALGMPGIAFWTMRSYNFINASERKNKHNIKNLSDEDLESLFNDIRNLELAYYNYTRENGKSFDSRIGTFTDSAPDYLLDEERSGIRLYEYTSLAMVGVK